MRLRVAVDNDKMQIKILKVVKSGEMFSVKSEKSETGQLNKRNLVLKELGGKYENEYAVSVLGNAAANLRNLSEKHSYLDKTAAI